jgi:hypothetical protein
MFDSMLIIIFCRCFRLAIATFSTARRHDQLTPTTKGATTSAED